MPQGRLLPALDRSTLRFRARKLASGINISAHFSAVNMLDVELRPYALTLVLNPETRRITHSQWRCLDASGVEAKMEVSDKDRELIIESQIRDLFLMTKAWEILRLRPPSQDFTIDEDGRNF